MEIEIKERRDNPLLGRTEVRFQVDHGQAATPKRNDVREKLAAVLNAKKDTVVVDHMASSFGRGSTRGYARIYASVDAMAKVERKFLLKRNGLEQYAPKKKERTPAPAAATKAKPKKGR